MERKSLQQKIGEYLIDISKLTFGGAVLTVALQVGNNKIVNLLIALIATVLIAVWGFIMYNHKN